MHLKNWSLIYPDTRTAELAPAYDFVSTIVFMPDAEMALSFVDSKAFESLTREQFIRFAAKTALPQKLTMRTIEETISSLSVAWKNTAPKTIDDKTRRTIDAHLETIPIWKEFND